MKILRNEEAQGATEYLLMLAAVLVVVAAAVYYVTSSAGGPVLAYNAENNADNVVITIGSGTSPSPMTRSWDWAVFNPDGTMSSSDWSTNDMDLEVGSAYSVTADEAGTGDTFKIRIAGTIFESEIKSA